MAILSNKEQLIADWHIFANACERINDPELLEACDQLKRYLVHKGIPLKRLSRETEN
jgi:hypothetical protein